MQSIGLMASDIAVAVQQEILSPDFQRKFDIMGELEFADYIDDHLLTIHDRDRCEQSSLRGDHLDSNLDYLISEIRLILREKGISIGSRI